jgi:predicted Rossmann fold nucleotide-binding protein DprA/Smf involved in DNA uptake
VGSTADGERIVGLFSAATAMALEVERLEREGASVMTPFDEGYPSRFLERLGAAAPPVLFAFGPVALLEGPAIAIVGSRDANEAALDVARRSAAAAVERGLVVISGGARGIDQQAMAAAYQAGGTTVGVLAESLVRRVRDPETRRVINEGRACFVTPYKPDAGFSVANAMGRNKIVYALAAATLVVTSDEGRGGTWEGATEALRRGYGTVATWIGAGSGSGNERLADLGARIVRDVGDASWMQEEPTVAEPEQLSLG